MRVRLEMAQQSLLRQVERWAPSDPAAWGRWRLALSPAQRAHLFELQAVLSGLVAFRRLDDPPAVETHADVRPHLHALALAYRWALALVGDLREVHPGPWRAGSGEPEASLRALELSLHDALRSCERSSTPPASAFRASADPFVRELSRNPFFCPPGPLDLFDVAEIAASFGRPAEPHGADEASVLVSLLTLLRANRFLVIADRQIGKEQGIYRAHVVVAAVRADLRAWSRFILAQGAESFAEQLEAHLLSVDAAHIASARADLRNVSRNLLQLRQSVQILATDLHAKALASLDEPLPALAQAGDVLAAERMRSGIRTVRLALRDAAKDLRRLASTPRSEHAVRHGERARHDLQQDVWAFRFILRAFVAKVSVASLSADDWRAAEGLEFIREFARHFRVFGPRLAQDTGYHARASLIRLMGALSEPAPIEPSMLRLAAHECARFADHLDAVLDRMPRSALAPFDKHKAAAKLRGYLAAAKDWESVDRVASGVILLRGAAHMQPDQDQTPSMAKVRSRTQNAASEPIT